MLNQLKSEFLKLKYSKLFIAVPILLLAGLILYGSFSLSSGGTQLFVSEGDEETNAAMQGMIGFLHLHLKTLICLNLAKLCSPVSPAMCFSGLLRSF